MNRTFVLLTSAAVVTAGLIVWSRTRPAPLPIASSVLGLTSFPDQTHFDSLVIPTSTPTPRVPVSVSVTPTQPIEESTIALIDGPGELVEGDVGTFTWYVGGLSTSIRTTTVYYGITDHPGTLSTNIKPEDTRYTEALKDFLQGDYAVPLRFVGNINQLTPGTYFYRAYASVDGKHYWSEERTFVVKQIPKHGITIVDRPGTLSSGGNAAFTWDIYGPTATTGFTVIVGGKRSKPGALDVTVDIPQTPYAVMVQDFTGGTYDVPLRFVGNANVAESGLYYFRALAFINGKNIWSDEYSFTVE